MFTMKFEALLSLLGTIKDAGTKCPISAYFFPADINACGRFIEKSPEIFKIKPLVTF